MDHTCHSQVFSTVTILLALLESTAEASHQQLAKRTNRSFSDNYYYYCFFHEATTILTGAIPMIQTRRSGISSGVLHPFHSVLKQIKLFGSNSQALEASTCRCTPFCSVPFLVTVHRKRSLEHELFCLDKYNTWSVLYDGPKVSCCSYVIIVRTLIQLLDHYRLY